MSFSFNPLWKLLIDKGMTKEKLRVALNFSPSTIAKMGKGEYVSMDVLHKICEYFNVQVNEIVEYFLVKSRCLRATHPLGPPLYSDETYRSGSVERGMTQELQ